LTALLDWIRLKVYNWGWKKVSLIFPKNISLHTSSLDVSLQLPNRMVIMTTNLSSFRLLTVIVFLCLIITACNLGGSPSNEQGQGNPEILGETEGVPEILDATSTQDSVYSEESEASIPANTTSPVPISPTNLILPEDIAYVGSFRLPESGDEFGWGYSGYAMTFYPEGDPEGPEDGYPGSLFILGHDQKQYVSEISIPTPVLSEAKDVYQLPYATTLQPFADIIGGMFGELEIPRAGLAYLPAQGTQSSGKLHFCWGQHFQFEQAPSHGWSELDLSNPNPIGPWYINGYTNYISNDYLFEIPEDWAAAYTPGLRLVTGRFRDGSWGGLGPAMLAIGPWNEGNPPSPNSILEQVTPLLLYGEPQPGNPEIRINENQRMDIYSEPDEWSGGAWLTADEKSAVILIGTKAVGESWYGFSNGVVYPISGEPDETYPEVPDWPHDDRGWWSEGISAQMIFFDPSELASVAVGVLETWEPQPYTMLVLDEYLYDPGFDYERYKRYLLGAVAFDRENGILYIVERLADEDRSLIHVFKVTS
jgi:hypothetical protein